MGLTFVYTEIARKLNSTKRHQHKFLVDSGALYSVVDHKVLEKIRVKPLQKQIFTLADGTQTELPIGFATFFYEDTYCQSPVVFGPGKKSSHFLLGATTLQALGLLINPLEQKLTALTSQTSN